jgi:hypothetical protein
MKKISEHSNKVRESNKNFFVLEKYNNDIKQSMLKSLAILEEEAKKLNMSVSEYAETLSKIAK